MTIAFARARALFISLVLIFAVAACGQSKAAYTFTAVTTEVAMKSSAFVDVRLIHGPSGKAVENAVIFDVRLDMSPESMGSMVALAEAQGSPEPGVYRFKVAPTMAGRWALTLKAKVPGAGETVTGTVVFKAL